VHSIAGLVGSIVVAALGVACSSSPASPDQSPVIPANQLVGTWNLLSLQPSHEQPTAAGAAYTLTFGNGNQFSTRGDCAMCSGTFGLTGSTLTTGPLLMCASIACQETAFDSRYKALLIGNTTVALSETTLELSSLRGVLRFKR
jgi:heat shock protein HslJ